MFIVRTYVGEQNRKKIKKFHSNIVFSHESVFQNLVISRQNFIDLKNLQLQNTTFALCWEALVRLIMLLWHCHAIPDSKSF